MSTARDALGAADAGLECAAVSCITNRAAGLSAAPLSHAEVLAAAAAASARLTELVEAFLKRLALPVAGDHPEKGPPSMGGLPGKPP
jgi:purine-nucleoside phosphorylase